jgi:tetratricopeptide (TPR) repeat protein
VLFHEGKYNEAKQLCFQIIEDNRFTTHIKSINYVRRILAKIYIVKGDTDKARQQLDLGFEEVQSNDDKRRIGYYNASFARLAIKLGDVSSNMDDKKTHYDEAEKYASKAMSAFCDLGMERNHIKVKEEIIGAIKEKRQQLK